MSDLLRGMIETALRAGAVMQVIRQSNAFPRLTMAKEGSKRFAVDAVTLADMVIQGVVVRTLGEEWPGLQGRVLGEETDDPTAPEHLRPSRWAVPHREDARALLVALLEPTLATRAEAEEDAEAVADSMFTRADGNELAADVELRDAFAQLQALHEQTPAAFASLYCWVDPLDATNEYVSGSAAAPAAALASPLADGGPRLARKLSGAVLTRRNSYVWPAHRGRAAEGDAARRSTAEAAAVAAQSCADAVENIGTGTTVVCFVCGIFDAVSGMPVLGVVHQPFGEALVWGVALGDVRATNVPRSMPTADQGDESLRIILSRAEDANVLRTLKGAGHRVAFVAGCGFKLLNVITGDADVFALVNGTAYAWDTCGAHGVLRALGGDVIEIATGRTVTYSTDRADAHHASGFVAFRDPRAGQRIAALLRPLLRAPL